MEETNNYENIFYACRIEGLSLDVGSAGLYISDKRHRYLPIILVNFSTQNQHSLSWRRKRLMR